MISADGRTDFEKLKELLRESEQDALEFKEYLDLDNQRDKLNLVKDLVTLSNNPDGGYLLIGVKDDGSLALPRNSIKDRKRYDGAQINDMIRKYVEGECEIISQIHDIDDHEVVVLFAKPHADGLPLPFSQQGQYITNGKKQKTVFRAGDLCVREGAQNNPLRHKHWKKLLSRHDASIRDETRKDIDAILQHLSVKGLVEPSTALELGVNDETFATSVRKVLDDGRDVALSRVISQMGSVLSAQSESFKEALQKITIIAVEALFYKNTDLANEVIEVLHQGYLVLADSRDSNAELLLDLAVHVYAIGSMAVRKESWRIVKDIALRLGSDNFGHQYSSWIRHIQVTGTRKKLFADDESGLLISLTRKLMVEHKYVRPDLLDVSLSENTSRTDVALNSLCQFDFLYCIWVFAKGQFFGSAYPSFSAFYCSRIDPLFAKIVDDVKRVQVLPTLSATEIADVLQELVKLADREAMRLGSDWEDIPENVGQFIKDNAAQKTDGQGN